MPVKEVSELPAEVMAAAQKVWFAGLGALAFAQDEGGKLFASLVAIGEQMEKEFRKSMPSPVSAVKDARAGIDGAWQKVQEVFDAQVTAALHRLGVPTKDEIAKLTRRIEALTASIEALKSRR